MNGLRVIEPGLLSVQDTGRIGFQRYGVSQSGAMDRFSLAVVNALLHQPASSAALEVGPFPVKIRAEGGPFRLAATGADRRIRVDGVQVDPGTTFIVSDGAVVSLDAARGGMFSYFGAEGGIKAEAQLGSLSVDERASLGSPYARPLRHGDCVELQVLSRRGSERQLRIDPPSRLAPVRVVLGPQEDYFHVETVSRFLNSQWVIAPNSNRMSYCLDGERLAHAKGYNIVSDGVVMGSIQVAGSGQPLVLLADRGTTGGYPKIATIISADLSRFVQTPVGAALSFRAISVAEAQLEARRLHKIMEELPGRVRPIGAPGFDTELLSRLNLAGDAVDALCDTE